MSEDLGLRALELWRAGVPLPRIADQLGMDIPTATQVLAAAREMHGQPKQSLADMYDGELDRLDRLQQGIWAKAARGDPAALDRVLKISEMRVRLAGAGAAQMRPELAGLESPDTMLMKATEKMLAHLDSEDRLQVEHLPLIALMGKLAQALESSGGRGASVAMLSAQFQEVWERLATLQPPPTPDAEIEYDVMLLPVVMMPDEG